MERRILALVSALGVCVTNLGCGTGIFGGVGGQLTPNVVAGTQAAFFMNGLNSVARVLPLLNEAASPFEGLLAVGDVTGTRTAGLESLQYFIYSVQICQNVDLSGSGYNNADGCIDLFTHSGKKDGFNEQAGGGGLPKYQEFLVTQAEADQSDGWIDLVSQAGKEKLAKPLTVTREMIGTYRYGLINFYRPIKMKANFLDMGDNSAQYRTKPKVASAVLPAGGSFNIEVIKIGDPTTGDAELMTYMMNNGGTVFPFVKPFEITKADFDNGEELKMDLVFNPADFAFAAKMSGSCPLTDSNSSICAELSGGNRLSFDVPFVKMNPVPRKSGQKTKKEVYDVANFINDASAKGALRMEIYYIDTDPSKSIYGVDMRFIPATDSNSVNGGLAPYAYGVREDAEGNVTLLSYDGSVTGGFKRRVTGPMTVMSTIPGEGERTVTATYVSDVLVSTD